MKMNFKEKDEWRVSLTEEQFRVAREGGTEAPFSGAYWDERRPGIYRCVCCDVVLFDSKHKYDSGSGWPSFTEVAASGSVSTHSDNSLGMTRTEVKCGKCDAHLGHVFPDGPAPTNTRYCINSVSLRLDPTGRSENSDDS